MDDIIKQNTTQQSRIERDAAAALRQIEEGARRAEKALAGDEAPVYLKMLGRIFAATGQGDPPGQGSPPGGSGLIIQP